MYVQYSIERVNEGKTFEIKIEDLCNDLQATSYFLHQKNAVFQTKAEKESENGLK